MRALFVDIQRPLDSRLLDPVTRSEIGGAAKSINKRAFKPFREFTLRVWDTMLRAQIEQLRVGLHGIRTTGVCYFDGDQYSEHRERIFIGNADGVQKEFPMPVDNPLPSSWKIWDNETPFTDWTMRDDVLVCGTAPSAGRLTGIGKQKFRVIILDQSDSILSESQIYTNDEQEGVYLVQPVVLLEVEGVNAD